MAKVIGIIGGVFGGLIGLFLGQLLGAILLPLIKMIILNNGWLAEIPDLMAVIAWVIVLGLVGFLGVRGGYRLGYYRPITLIFTLAAGSIVVTFLANPALINNLFPGFDLGWLGIGFLVLLCLSAFGGGSDYSGSAVSYAASNKNTSQPQFTYFEEIPVKNTPAPSYLEPSNEKQGPMGSWSAPHYVSYLDKQD
jgi:hypothetical protein